MNKYIVLVSFDHFLGGAQIRYLSLFKEITVRNSDYILVVNRKLYEIALKSKLIDSDAQNIIILEKKKSIAPLQNSSISEISDVNKTKKINSFRKIRRIKNQIISLIKLINYSYKLNRIFRIKKPSYVYGIWGGGMIAWPLKYYYRFKFVYSYMDSGYSSIYSGLKNPLKNERMALKNADIIDFLSNDLYLGVKDRVSLSKKTKISITPSSFKDYTNFYPVYPKTNTVVFCSRMTPIKNPLLLLESIKLFNMKYSNWSNISFQFLGDGECFNQMKLYVNNNQLTNVNLLGNVSNTAPYLQQSKIFVSIQGSNNYPSQSLLEAMACGNAIIASDVGETRKLVTEEEGVLVKLETEEIVNALFYLLENKERCTMLGKNARVKVLTDHSLERYLKHFYSLENI